MRSINKNRDDILEEIDHKNQSLRETETQLKLTKNDIEIIQSKNKQLEALSKEQQEKIEQMESKQESLKDQLHQTQKEKDHTVIQLNNKIEILQYKLLNNPADSVKNDGPEASFKELINLCRGDLTEIKSKVGNIATHANVEDKLRKEIIE